MQSIPFHSPKNPVKRKGKKKQPQKERWIFKKPKNLKVMIIFFALSQWIHLRSPNNWVKWCENKFRRISQNKQQVSFKESFSLTSISSRFEVCKSLRGLSGLTSSTTLRPQVRIFGERRAQMNVRNGNALGKKFCLLQLRPLRFLLLLLLLLS